MGYLYQSLPTSPQQQAACQLCHHPPYHADLCRSCYVKRVDKRIRKMIRTQFPIQPHDTLIISDPLCTMVIKDTIQGLPVTINGLGDGKHVIPWTADDEIYQFLDRLFTNKPLHDANPGQHLKLFLCLTAREYEAYAAAKGYPAPQRQPSPYAALIDQIEMKHKETRPTLLKTIDELNHLFHTG